MSRLDDEYIMAVVRNRSGISSGEIDYNIKSYRFHRQPVESLKEIKKYLKSLSNICDERIETISNCDHKDYALEEGRLHMYECRRCFYRWLKPFEKES